MIILIVIEKSFCKQKVILSFFRTSLNPLKHIHGPQIQTLDLDEHDRMIIPGYGNKGYITFIYIFLLSLFISSFLFLANTSHYVYHYKIQSYNVLFSRYGPWLQASGSSSKESCSAVLPHILRTHPHPTVSTTSGSNHAGVHTVRVSIFCCSLATVCSPNVQVYVISYVNNPARKKGKRKLGPIPEQPFKMYVFYWMLYNLK